MVDLTRYIWTTDDVAKKLGYNVQYVRQLANRSALPALKRIRQWLFDPAEVQRFLEKRTQEATRR